MKIFLSLFRNFPAIGNVCTKWHIFVCFWLKNPYRKRVEIYPEKIGKKYPK